MINEAITFATQVHGKQTRKGTNIPYIFHCLEAGMIAMSLTEKDGEIDRDVVCAAILHDTTEEAYVSFETLKEVFNENIANLVNSQSEDKSKKVSSSSSSSSANFSSSSKCSSSIKSSSKSSNSHSTFS